ncbi:MAG: enoyl-CoA hydratase-related protein, partial [Planctomycetota bacterium]
MSSVALEFPADVPDSPELVSMRREGDLVWLTIERPEVMNCLSFPTLKRIRTLCEELREDLSVRCVLITGSGEKAFCAGADLKERKTMPKERVPEFVKNIRRTMDDVEALPQPTIAVVNGFAFGGGTELLLACDLRVAATTAKFGLTEVALAIIPGAGGTQRLPRLVGKSRAKDLILTGRRIDAVEGERIGLVNRVAEPSELNDVAREVAEAIAANGPVAVRAAKDAIDRGGELPIEAGLAVEA